MRIVIGSDHRGFDHKEFIKANLKMPGRKIAWIDVGCASPDPCDYPIFAGEVAQALQAGQADVGILLCSTGIGMSIAANRFKGIYAGLVWDEKIASLSKEDDNTNVLVLPADFISTEQAIAMIEAWINAEFQGGRHQRRVDLINEFGGA